jgi:hypothetical protein
MLHRSGVSSVVIKSQVIKNKSQSLARREKIKNDKGASVHYTKALQTFSVHKGIDIK